MNIKKLLIGASAGVLMLAAMTATTFAAGLFQNPKNWKILDRVTLPNGSVNFMTRHPDALPAGGMTFPLLDSSKGYTSYLLLNHNRDLTGKTITANVTTNGGSFVANPSGGCDNTATVGLEFQDTSAGAYDSNDYWWHTDRQKLSDITVGHTFTGSLAERSEWTNQSGKSATDPTEDWVQWQGDIVHMSPYDGFTKAMKNVKEVSLSFGCTNAYARGVAVTGGTGSFELNSYTITP